MRICQPHWDKIRAKIKELGLDHLGAKSGEQAHADMVAQANGEETAFDPLMTVNHMITSKALEHGGLYLMGVKEDGSHYCPICEALAHKPDDVDLDKAEQYWIEGPTNAVLKMAQEGGHVPKTQ